MKKKIVILLFVSSVLNISYTQTKSGSKEIKSVSDIVSQLTEVLTSLSANPEHPLILNHCQSILNVIHSVNLSDYEKPFLEQMYSTFTDTTIQWNAGDIKSYLERKRPFIISWTSPTDKIQSLAWMVPPTDWDIAKSYPLYVSLHGLYQPYSNPIEYMARYLSPETILEKSFDDGYSIYPWGRGNLWYEGIGATDVWESIEALDSLVNIDSKRRYLVGHSMGGYGAWVIGQNSPDYWAAIGIYAGALWYNGGIYLNQATADKLKDVPVYIVCGTQDGLLSNNQTAYNLLVNAGNENVKLATFPGGHESTFENWENMYHWIKDFSNERITSVGSTNTLPELDLLSNYPNPFNPETTINYTIRTRQLATGSNVTLKIYDVLGNKIATLVDKETLPGSYKINWNAEGYPSGVYFCTLESGELITSQKLLLLK